MSDYLSDNYSAAFFTSSHAPINHTRLHNIRLMSLERAQDYAQFCVAVSDVIMLNTIGARPRSNVDMMHACMNEGYEYFHTQVCPVLAERSRRAYDQRRGKPMTFGAFCTHMIQMLDWLEYWNTGETPLLDSPDSAWNAIVAKKTITDT